MPDLTNPHDRFFKATFSRPELAADFLRHYLPAPVAAHLDLTPDAVKLRKGSFVDRHLRHRASDLLYQVRFRDGREGLVYVVFEHKSYQDKHIALQLLTYMARIWAEDLRRGKGRKLLPIIPVVVYHGRTAWRTPANFGALFDGPDALRSYCPDFVFQVTDFSVQQGEVVRDVVAALRTVLLALREGPHERLKDRLVEVLAPLREVADRAIRQEILMMVLNYIAEVNKRVTAADAQEALDRALPETGGDAMPTMAETWIAQGIERGRQEGLQAGLREGTRSGHLAGIELALDVRFAAAGLALMPEIRAIDEVATLQAVLAATRTAGTPAEVRAVYAVSVTEG